MFGRLVQSANFRFSPYFKFEKTEKSEKNEKKIIKVRKSEKSSKNMILIFNFLHYSFFLSLFWFHVNLNLI